MIEALEEEKNGTDPRSPKRKNGDITHTGKVVGTIAYMAPERALGHPATIQTDIYSLGVILYQMLTLRSPFKRGTLEEFKKKIPLEEWIDPVLAAPYRDVPGILARITEKCMANQISQRYQSVNELIHDVENYIEGRSEWFQIAELDIKNKADWEFQENVLIAEHIAITRMTEEAEWVGLMVSRSSFSGNTKLEADICLGEEGNGIGFLMSVPETNQRTHITDGYCLWLGSDINKSTKLLRSNVEVMQASDIFLKRHQWYHIRIEKIEQTLHVYIDDHLQFSYIAHIPLIGTHVGLLARDADFQISSLKVSVGSLNIMVNCLAVPDAFLAHKDFDQALSEYRRIASSFRDRAEGREARFRAGLTLIEKAKESSEKEALLDESLAEFEKLHGTPGAPLEYLGKALVYQTLSDYEEEIKCFELAYRRYPQHPLLPVLQEQVISRMHTVSRHNRIATYNFILLAIRLLPLVSTDIHTNRLFSSLQKHWEPLPFIENPLSTDKFLQYQHFAIQLAFWLAKPYVLGEIIEDIFRKDPSALVEMGNALFSLIKLGAWQYSKAKLKSDLQSLSHLNDPILIALQQDIKNQQTPLEQNLDFYLELLNQRLEPCYVRSLVHFLDLALDQEKMWLIHAIEEKLEDKELAFDKQLKFNIRIIWAYLLENNWEKAAEIIERYPFELINKESTPLYFLYACLLQATEGVEAAQAQFKNVMRVSYPRSWILGCHYLAGYLSLNDPWFEKAFLWEKRELFRQLTLYYHCAQDKTQETQFRTLYNQQFIYVDPQ
jgi:eukaryotic-like serine/threonine-protein kinase